MVLQRIYIALPVAVHLLTKNSKYITILEYCLGLFIYLLPWLQLNLI